MTFAIIALAILAAIVLGTAFCSVPEPRKPAASRPVPEPVYYDFRTDAQRRADQDRLDAALGL